MAIKPQRTQEKGLRVVRLNYLRMNRGSKDTPPQPREDLSLLADPSAHQKAAKAAVRQNCSLTLGVV